MKTHQNSQSRRGMTYLSVTISAAMVGIILASYLTLVASQNNNTMRSQAWNRSVAVIEAGIEEAIAHLNKNGSPDASGVYNFNLGTDGWTSSGGAGWWKSNSLGGGDYYIVRISPFNPPTTFPTILSQGYVKQLPTYAKVTKFAPFLADIVPGSGGAIVRRSVICTTTNVPVFTKALVAKDTIDLSGMNVYTDSFDSGNPLYSTNVNGVPRYTVSRRKDNGDIATNRGITNSADLALNVNNAKIWGHVSTGPNQLNPGTGLVNLNQAKVGDAAWQLDNEKSGIKPGWATDDMNVEFPEVKVPFSGGSTPQQNVTISNVTYDFVFQGSGDFRMPPGLNLSGKIYISGNPRIAVESGIDIKGSDSIIYITPGSSVKVYADCPSSNISGQGVSNPGLATNFYYFGTAKNTSLQYGGNAAFTGVFYAPSAQLQMGGGGNTTIDFSGSAIVGSVKMTGNFSFHYDENLKRIGLYRGYILTSWNEM